MDNTFSFTKVVCKRLKQVLMLVIVLAIGSAIGLALRPYIGVAVGSCMSPNIRTGDISLLHHPGEIQRGDVITFWYDGEARGDSNISGRVGFGKRVIGLPGEDIYFDDNGNVIYINGQLLDESAYVQKGDWDPYPPNSGWGYHIPEGCYFVMGDNRGNSYDSRYWPDPFVYQEDIVGVQWLHIPMPIPDAVRSLAEQPLHWIGVPHLLVVFCIEVVLVGWFLIVCACIRLAVFVLRALTLVLRLLAVRRARRKRPLCRA